MLRQDRKSANGAPYTSMGRTGSPASLLAGAGSPMKGREAKIEG
jgi:hypothetical protein